MEDVGHVLLETHPATKWLNEQGDEIAGFQGYGSCQYRGTDADRDKAQRLNILSFLPWTSWEQSGRFVW